MCYFSLYFPPFDPSNKMNNSTISKLLGWIGSVLAALPLGCTPILMMDANSGFGYDDCGQAVNSSALGAHAKGRENPMCTKILHFAEG